MAEARINALVHGCVPGTEEPPHEIFLELCEHALSALAPYADDLTKSPVAGPLLAYMGSAMVNYIRSIQAAKPPVTATDRREFLSHAFSIVGKSGNPLSLEKRQDICSAFSGAIYSQQKGNGKKPTPKQTTAALHETYEVLHGEAWIPDCDTAKKRITQLRRILVKEGCL